MISNFLVIRTLGQGGFGKVFEAQNRLDDKIYAIKTIPIYGNKERVLKEAKALGQLGEHLNITTYYHCWLSPDDISIPNEQLSQSTAGNTGASNQFEDYTDNSDYGSQTESRTSQGSSHFVLKPAPMPTDYLYIQMGLYEKTLQDWLWVKRRHRPTDSYEHILRMTLHICVALAEIHRKGFIHRDLKPANIFLKITGDTFCTIVGDFGLVTGAEQSGQTGRTTNIGTPPYAAPETVRISKQEKLGAGEYDNKVDVYALGVILLELFNPVSTRMERCRLIDDAIQSSFSEHFARAHSNEVDQIRKMLSRDPGARPRVGQTKNWVKTVLNNSIKPKCSCHPTN